MKSMKLYDIDAALAECKTERDDARDLFLYYEEIDQPVWEEVSIIRYRSPFQI